MSDAIHNGRVPVRIIDVGGPRFFLRGWMVTSAPDVPCLSLPRHPGVSGMRERALYLGA